ncbi:ApaLI family restriction endonuclease [Moorella sp. Hama-1]|uniref:ApaLI family restriction endonuclease n=1 Tax=Moorella sp. Hama-1 TaxID=2138101 RepID=UPI000D6517B8|nr:ApaLI family restriction endonuclease [Moorella sp. Hama-1]MDN5361398.1 hypothetical protein [Moorella sp. (in: firmicutes)]BCV22131.1 restriction endonuclease [Moorella sp. Hama-1]
MKSSIEEQIRELASRYSRELKEKIDERLMEMADDDKSHYLIYHVLGITNEEGELIDQYQNKGRFLYKYAGSFLEDATIACFLFKYPQALTKVKIENFLGRRPKTFEIDCLVGKDAYEIKWRDATTDGDHITKEHTRLRVIEKHGYKPIRIMFYYPNREQAIRIQDTLKTLYEALKGEYYSGNQAWEFVHNYTDVDLKGILTKIAHDNLSKRD